MSADNGTYILRTTHKDSGYEYRVIAATAIDNIYGLYIAESSSFLPDKKMMIKYFGPAKIFLDMEAALLYADGIESDMNLTEHGICIISEFKDYMFEDFQPTEV